MKAAPPVDPLVEDGISLNADGKTSVLPINRIQKSRTCSSIRELSRVFGVASCLLCLLGLVCPVRGEAQVDDSHRRGEADLGAPDELASYGVFYDRYEPTFYTGFAPRALNPRHLHLHVGRGNQLRVTLVLSDQILEGYARDLLARHRSYRQLIDNGKLVLTQNRAFEAFEATIGQLNLEETIRHEAKLVPEELRQRNLKLMENLNPGRVFFINFPEQELVRRWSDELRESDRGAMTRQRRLELVNSMLPTRLWVTELDPGVNLQWPQDSPLPHTRQVATDQPPAHQNSRPHPERNGLQLFPVDPLHACRREAAQLLSHLVVAHGP